MKDSFLLIVFLCLLILSSSQSAYADDLSIEKGYKAWIALSVLTTRIPALLAEYKSGNHPSYGIFTDLWANALAIQDYRGRKAAIPGQSSDLRERNKGRNRIAKYLTENLKDFPKLAPQKLYEGTTTGSFYLNIWAYKKEHFSNTSREKFPKTTAAKGISLSPYLLNWLHREHWNQHNQILPEYKKRTDLRVSRNTLKNLICPDSTRSVIKWLWS